MTKTGVERRRRLLPQHLGAFPWLAVSRHPGMERAFCVACVLFAAGSRIGGTQRSGRTVTVPLVKFDDLTGKDGVLPRHQNTQYHQRSVMDDFKRVVID